MGFFVGGSIALYFGIRVAVVATTFDPATDFEAMNSSCSDVGVSYVEGKHRICYDTFTYRFSTASDPSVVVRSVPNRCTEILERDTGGQTGCTGFLAIIDSINVDVL